MKPLRDERADVLGLFNGFFERDRLLVADVTREVLDRTSELRVRYGLKTPDAIHLATALLHQASTLLTADPDFQRCDGIQTVLIDPAVR